MKRVLKFLGLAALCGLGLNALADTVAKIEDVNYSSLQDAVENCWPEQTVVLMKDVNLGSDENSNIFLNQGQCRLDLNGKTITACFAAGPVVTSVNAWPSPTVLTICDRKGGGKVVNTSTFSSIWNAVFNAENGGIIRIEGGSFVYSGPASGGGLFYEDGGSFEVAGGTFNADPTAYLDSGCTAIKNDDGTWTVPAELATVSPAAAAQIPAVSYEKVSLSSESQLNADVYLDMWEAGFDRGTTPHYVSITDPTTYLYEGSEMIPAMGVIDEVKAYLGDMAVRWVSSQVGFYKAGTGEAYDSQYFDSLADAVAAVGADKFVVIFGDNAEEVVGGTVPFTLRLNDFAYDTTKFTPASGWTLKDNGDGTLSYEKLQVAEVFAAEESKGRYVTLKEAFDAVADIPGKTATIKIIADFNVTFPSGFYIVNHSGQNITLDLNGKSICCTATANGGNALIENNGTLKIIDSAGHADEVGRWIGGSIVYETKDYWTSSEEDRLGYAGDLINNKRFLTVSGGKLENKTSGGTATYALDLLETGWEGSGSFTTVEGGEIVAATTAIRLCQNAEHAESDAGSGVHLTIKGGLIEGFNFTVYVQESNAVKGKFLSLNIEGGTILSQYDAICMIGSDGSWDNFTGTISGGAFYGDIDFHSYPSSQKFPLKITGGNFYRGGEYTDHGVRVDATKPYLKYIEGGRYWYDDDYDKESIYDSCSDLVVKGKRLVCSEDDTYWYVGDIPYVVQVVSSDCTETNGYETLSEAFDAVVAGETVMLLADSAEDVLIPVGVTFDTNGKAYTGTLAAPACYRLKDLGDGKWSVELDGGKCPAVIYDAEGNPTYYATFAEAVNAAAPGGTVSVNREIAETEPVEIANKELTFDLAGQVVNANISFTGAATDFIIDSVGGGKVLGTITVGKNCTLKIRAGTYADPNVVNFVDQATDPATGRALYVVVVEKDALGNDFFKVMPNQIEVKEPDPKDVAMADESGNEIPPSEVAEAAAAIVKANTEIKQTIQQNSSIDTGIEGAAKESVTTPSGEIVPGPAKSGVVKALQGEAPEAAKGQITAESDISSRLVIDIKSEISTIRTVEEPGVGTRKDAIFTTILYKVEPIVKTVVTVTDGAGNVSEEVVEATLPNEELKKSPLTFRLGIKDPAATGAYVKHIGHDEFEDETVFCKVQGLAGGRYVELTVDHFSDFEVRTVDAVIVDTDDAVGIVNLGVPEANKELAAAVPFLKSGVSGFETAPNATLADLVVTGRENGDTIVFQKTGAESGLSGDAWDGDAAQETGTAFWYKSVGSSVPLTLAGLVTDTVETAVTAGSSDEPKATLLVNPYASAQDVFAAVGDAAQDGDQVALVGGDVRYVRENGAWGYWKKSEYRAKEEVAQGGLFMSNEFVRVTSLSVPGGKGVWYVSKNATAPTIAWTAGVQTGAAEQIANAGLPTFGSVAWDVSLTAADMDAFAPEKVNLVAYDASGARVGDYARPLVVDALGQHRTSFLGVDGYDWTDKDVTAAEFAVELLDADEHVLASTEKVGFGDLLTEKALDVTYAGDVTPAVALTPRVFAGFSVSDNGGFASLADAFAGFGYVTKKADRLEVTLTNDMQGVVTIADNLGSVTLDLNGHSITGKTGVASVGGVALAVTGHIDPGGAPTQLLVKDRTGNGGKIVGGDGALAANGFDGGAAIVVADGVGVTLATGDAKPLVKGGAGGTGYVSAGAAGFAVADASGNKVTVSGTDDTALPGEFWKAWAWCTCAAAPTAAIAGTYHEGTTLWIYQRDGDRETGVAEFDFGQLKDLAVEGNAIHFVAGKTDVGTLTVGEDAFDGIAFLGDDLGTTLFATPGWSAFSVTRGDEQTAVWSNLTFASDGEALAFDVNGRAISQTGGAFEIADCVFTNCAANVGGAVFAEFLAKDSRIVDSTFADNAALGVNGEGGALFAAAAGAGVTLAVADCTFTGNYADMNGGAIGVTPYADFGGQPLVLAVSDTRFADNEAKEAGGAVCGYAKELLVEADATKDDPGTTAFEGNRAGFYGGAVAFAYDWSFGIVPQVRMGRGVTFTDNVASNDTAFGTDASYTFGGAIAVETPTASVLELTGVAFTSNAVWALDGAFGGAVEATTWDDACAVLVDTCVFDGNSAGCTNANSTLCYGGALSFEWAGSVVKNSTFRRSNREAVAVIAGSAAITNCVAVGNGETVGGYDLEDLYFDGCAVDMAYTAYGDAYLAGTASLAETFNLTNREETIYAGDTLRLNPVGFNPVAALGVKQEAYDFVGVKYGSKAYGSSMGAYETPTERLYVNLNGDKTYDGTTASNDVAWTWTYTTESGAPAAWDDFVTADEFDSVFTLTNWVYGCKDHGYYATTNMPPNLDAQIRGNDDVAQWYLDSGILEFVATGTIARRPISMGGLEFTIDPDEYEWNDGNPVDATVTVVERIGDLAPLTLAEGTDYHLTCSENTDYTKKAVATADLLHNWIGSTNDTYYVTAYLVEYLYDDVVDASLTETYGKTSGVAVAVSEIPDPRDGYAFDLYNSPTNGTVRKFDEGDGILRLKVCYYADVAPADGIPDIYQRKVLAKVVNGSWGEAGANGSKGDATLYATLWDAGKWSRTGKGEISYGTVPTAGNHAFAEFSAGGWLALTSEGLKIVDPATHVFAAGDIPFLVYAYSHGSQTTGGSGRGHGTTGRTGATTPAQPQTGLLDQYKGILSIADATFSTADGKIVLKAKAVVSGNGTTVDLPMEGATLKVYATEALGKPWSAVEATADGEGKVEVDIRENGAASCFFKVGL